MAEFDPWAYYYTQYGITDESVITAVRDFYGTSSTLWDRYTWGTSSAEEILNAYNHIPSVSTVTSIDGTVLGVDSISTIPVSSGSALVPALDSNTIPSSSVGVRASIPSAPSAASGGGYNMGAGAIKSGGTTLAAVADKLSLGVVGVSMGAKFGKQISDLLYADDEGWWATHFPDGDPSKWPTIAGESETGQAFIRALFGIDSNSNSAYVDETVLAYAYLMMQNNGFFNPASDSVDASPEIKAALSGTQYLSFPLITSDITSIIGSRTVGTTTTEYKYTILSGSCSSIVYSTTAASHPFGILASSSSNFELQRWQYSNQGWVTAGTYTSNFTYTYDGKTVYFHYLTFFDGFTGASMNSTTAALVTEFSRSVAWLLVYGDITPGSTVPGVTDLPNSTPITGITGTTTDEVLQQLKTNYPQLFDGSVTSPVLQSDGSIKDYNYVPIPWSTGLNKTNPKPTTGDATQTSTQIPPSTMTQNLDPTTPDTPTSDTGYGDGSPDNAPTGAASSLWAVYNPTQTQLDSFGSWLWSSNFVDQLKKLFNDPMQAIIGVHKVYANPPTNGNANIVCGYLDSGVSAARVSSQYTSIDCGTVNLYEYFGNVFDYDPYTKVSVYLPFIGVVSLKTSEVMRSTVNITYGVDVITGACLAKIKITRDGAGAILYSYGGSCACHYPISSGSYSGIISGVVTAAVGIAAGVVSKNPVTAVGGAVSGIKQAHTEYQHSGGFTGCSGAMGPKIPYIIIERPQTKMAAGYEDFEGVPQNEVVLVGSCSGYARFSEIHVSSSRAYDAELSEIETLLKNGVLI